MADFIRLAEPYRAGLLAHCYRMLGSLDDAEDLVQETYLRGWRGYAGFEGRASLRTWLYKIATSACLTALEHRSRRVLPSGLTEPVDESEVAWLQPLPDPAVVVADRGSVRLALVAALQYLPPRQRAVLLLRDVLAWRAAEVADLLESSVPAVNSLLQRARAQLAEIGPREDDPIGPLDPERRALLDQYLKAFEALDVPALVRVLHEDVTLEMPPQALWLRGRAPVARFFAERIFPSGSALLVPTGANGQPAFAHYQNGLAHAILVLELRDGAVGGITAFRTPSLFPAFGLPAQSSDLSPPGATR